MPVLTLPSPQPAALRARLHGFNLLPSRLWHPARMPAWQQELQALGPLAGQPALQQQLHRRWSGQLLAQLGAGAAPVTDSAQPALALALARPALLAQLQRQAGVLLLAPRLRRMVERSQVLALRAALGAELLHWAYAEAGQLHPGLGEGHAWLDESALASDPAQAEPAQRWAARADLLGAGLLAQSWQDAPINLRARADGRLPPAADDPALRQASGLDAGRARRLCLELLQLLDAPWLSSFPVTP